MNKTITKLLNGFDQIKKMDLLFNVEVWKDIECYNNYAISSYARVKNIKTGRIMKQSLNNHGYYSVFLCDTGHKRNFQIHRLIAKAFIPNLLKKPCVDHIDNNRTNNNLNNLRWVTYQENQMNSKISIKNTSGFKGVCYDRQSKKWLVRISIKNNSIFIGLFDTIKEAVKARKAKANELFGEFTNKCERLNSSD